jgi:hypothetical protein
MEVELPPTALIGTWRLERTVHDRLAGTRFEVVGTTTLARVSDGHVSWHESGTMTSVFGTVPVSRQLAVVAGASGEWFVRFADGRDFHPWRVGVPVVHHCAPDTYRGLITVDSDVAATWSVVWDASGPEKDYRMESRLSGSVNSALVPQGGGE